MGADRPAPADITLAVMEKGQSTMLSLEAFAKAKTFFQEHLEALLKDYKGKYIAMADGVGTGR